MIFFCGFETPGSTSDVRPGAIFFDPLRGLFLIGFERGERCLVQERGEGKQSDVRAVWP
jgi:hypothetical protein